MIDKRLRRLIQENQRTVLNARALLLSQCPDGWDVEFSYDESARTMRLTPAPPKGTLLWEGAETRGSVPENHKGDHEREA